MKLLIVEDEPRTREGIKKIVEQTLKKIDITTCCNGKEALDLCERQDYDVIFTDIKMPVMTGLEFLNKLDKRNKQIVIISGYNDFNYAKEAIKNNVVDYLLKPVDVFKLQDLLINIEKRYKLKNTQALKKYLLEYNYLSDSIKTSLATRLLVDHYYFMIKVRDTTEEKINFYLKDLINEDIVKRYQFNVIDDFYIVLASNNKEELEMIESKLDETIAETFLTSDILEDSSLLYEKFDNLLTVENPQNEGNIIVSTVKNYIDEHYESNINLNTLCELVYVHPTYLSKLFKKETEMTITEYIIQVRITKAKILLKDPKNRIYEVASLTGFKDSKYFANVFKQVTGMTPMEYKNSAINQE